MHTVHGPHADRIHTGVNVIYVLLSQLIHIRGSGSAQLDSLRITRNETRVLSSPREEPSFLVAIELHSLFLWYECFYSESLPLPHTPAVGQEWLLTFSGFPRSLLPKVPNVGRCDRRWGLGLHSLVSPCMLLPSLLLWRTGSQVGSGVTLTICHIWSWRE